MKLKHRITGTILMIAFATTTALPAATIPQLKNPPKAVAKVPSAPVAPRIPVVPKVNVPAAPKVPAVKVPVVKVPVTPRIVSAPKVPVVKAAPKTPVTPKIVSAPNISSVKTPAAPKMVKTARQIDMGKLKNLKEKLPLEIPELKTRAVFVNGEVKNVAGGIRGDDFIRDNFGQTGPDKPGTFVDTLKAEPVGRDRNPLSGNPLDNMITTRGGSVSENPNGGGKQDGNSQPSRNVSFDGAVISKGGVTYLDNRPNVAAPFIPNDPIVSTGYGTSSPASKLRQGNKKEPAPDDNDSSGAPRVTKDDIKGIEAFKNRHSTPTDEESSSGGHINTGANGTGRADSLSQPAGDGVRSAVRMTAEDMRAMQVRINARINTGGR